jgi:hypothetical protein
MSLLASVQRIRLLGSECRQIPFSELDHGADADVFLAKLRLPFVDGRQLFLAITECC